MIGRVTTLLLSLQLLLSAQVLNIDFFDDKPKSLAKDFYISEFLKQGVSDKEAQKLLAQVKNLNPKLFKKFAKHIDKFKRKAYCQQLQGEQFLGTLHDCVKAGLSLYKATTLPPALLKKIARHIQRTDPLLAKQYFAISAQTFDALLHLPPKQLISTFNSVGNAFRATHYNYPLPKEILPALLKEKSFPIMIEKIVRGNFIQLQESLQDVDAQRLDAESNFLLALNALRFKKKEEALSYLATSLKKAKFTFEKDKALFWTYLLTKEKNILEKLTDSYEINIYSLYASETLARFPTNITTEILPKTTTRPIDISDPFAWITFKKKAKTFKNYEDKKKWLLQYNSPEMEPHIAKLLYRFKANQHYYLTPYAHYLQNSTLERKVLIYALARQESNFIPSEVSYSYALGMMQFMPYVAKDIAVKEGIVDFEYHDMFKPEVAYHFANIHLDFLKKSLKHPLLIAYAYNAGIGFTKRNILRKDYFKENFYEPFWSLEMIPNAQARKYGKRVLANYVVYAKRLGLQKSLKDLLKTIR